MPRWLAVLFVSAALIAEFIFHDRIAEVIDLTREDMRTRTAGFRNLNDRYERTDR